MKLGLFIFITLSIKAAASISWIRRKPTQSLPSLLGSVYEKEEITALLKSSEGFEAYAHRSDCFQRAAGNIRVRCGELELNEDERVQAAIAMTICELATAKQLPPMECSPFSSQIYELSVDLTDRYHGGCVEALSRSAQYWSSYSGYLREVPQLCHAFRRWNDIDTAREIYRNATLETVGVVRILNQYEHKKQEMQDYAFNIITQMKDVLSDMAITNSRLTATSESVHTQIQGIHEQVLGAVRHVILNAERDYVDQLQVASAKLSVNLEHVAADHAISLAHIVPTIEANLQYQIDTLFSGLWKYHSALEDTLKVVHERWEQVGGGFHELVQSVNHLSANAASAATQLQTHATQAAAAHRAQHEATESTKRLSETLVKLTEKTNEEMKRINNTATAVREELLLAGQSHHSLLSVLWWSHQGWSNLLWLVEVVLKVEPVKIQYLASLPTFKAISMCASVAWYIVQAALASLTGFFLLTFSRHSSVSSSSVDSRNRRGTCQDEKVRPECSVPMISNMQSARRAPNSRLRMSRIPDRLFKPTADRY